MMRLASIALASILGVAGVASAAPAKADPCVTVGWGVPGYVAGPYAYVRGPGYWHRDFYRRDFYRGNFDHYPGHYWGRR
jgi:hypothetical protein